MGTGRPSARARCSLNAARVVCRRRAASNLRQHRRLEEAPALLHDVCQALTSCSWPALAKSERERLMLWSIGAEGCSLSRANCPTTNRPRPGRLQRKPAEYIQERR